MKYTLKFSLIIFLISNLFLVKAISSPQENKMLDNLTQELISITKTYPGKVGLYLHDLKTDQKITINADENFFMASTYKVPILIQLYRDHDAGLLSVNDKITLTSEMTTSGYGLLKSFLSIGNLNIPTMVKRKSYRVVCGTVAIPLVWKFLPKKGNSNLAERIEVFEKFIRIFGSDFIKDLVADREFASSEWFKWLDKRRIPFSMVL